MRPWFGLVALGFIITTTFGASSEAASINFDALAASTNLGGTPDNPASVLDTDLSSLGIVFGLSGVSTGVAVISNTSAAFSDPNSITGLDSAGQMTESAAGNLYFSFVAPGTLTPSVTDFVSFRIGDDGGDLDSWTINAYGLGDVLINTQLLAGTAHQLYTLNLAGIARIEILNTTGTAAGFGVDDLTFNDPAAAAAVPEPTTLLLLGSGLLASRRWRRRSAQ